GAGYPPDEIIELMDSLSRAMFRPTWPAGSLLSNAGLRAALRRVVGQARIEEMPIPLAIVAADIIGRREVVFRRGPLCPALIASMAIPGIYPAQKIGPYTLVDGGVINPVPCNVAAEMGADIVIGVKLPSPATAVVADATSSEPSGHGPGTLQVLQRAIELMQTRIVAETAAKATILLEPEFTDIGAWGVRNFRRGRVYVEQGEAAAEAALPRLAAVLPWLRG